MRSVQNPLSITRRDLLRKIGVSAGAAMMYQAMSTLGFARESDYRGPIDLAGAPKGTSILILGAGMAGLVAAYELRRAGYTVKVLEYNHRAGGRSWTLRGGDEYTELGGHKQKCEFDPGLYVNPGPWRIPYHHHGMLDYARRLKVPLEPFNQLNFNAYLHSSKDFGGKPQRYRHIYADYHGHIAELLSKAVNKGQLDAELTTEDKERLLQSLRTFGVLDKDYRYVKSFATSESRGYDSDGDRGAGLMPAPQFSTPIARDALLKSGLANYMVTPFDYDLTPSMFQPVGGMDRIAMALYNDVAPLVELDAKVTAIDQDERGVSVTYVDARRGGEAKRARADWCLCTIPLSILSEIPVKVSEPMLAAIQSAPYEASVKFGLQFKRRFWEDDERIYGGISFTDLPIQMIGYPMAGMNAGGKGVLLGGYVWGTNAYEFNAMTPEQRIRKAVELGAQIHPQYPAEFENGVVVSWHRSPFTQGCFANWSDAAREKHYVNLCQIDGRIALAGEHASRLPAWQEGAVLSSLDTISRMHKKIVATA